MASLPWLVVGIICSILGYAFYAVGVQRQLVEPSRASWLIWSSTTAIEALTYTAVNHGALQNMIFSVSAVSSIGITLMIWRRSHWERPSLSDSLCMAACLASMIVWLGFQNAWWAHLLVIAAIPASFVPTWIATARDKARELSPAWGFWTLGDLATLLVSAASERSMATELPYILIELICHAGVWLIIGLPTINPARSFRWARGRLLSRVTAAGTGLPCLVGRTDIGKAVFTERAVPRGSAIVEFTGPRIHRNRIKAADHESRDRFLQIGHDIALGASGGVDDIVNHSCDPNCGLRFTGSGIFLTALRDIGELEELTWDYSTTWIDFPGEFSCRCGSETCRTRIGDFRTLPLPVQLRYRDSGVVPDYVLKAAKLEIELPLFDHHRRRATPRAQAKAA